ncbi:MAG: S41 family peptidase [Candidatus Obscuribacterales bacterium]|nr:S41 family peptidase [Candidatus Obscuribacterales bacterium]
MKNRKNIIALIAMAVLLTVGLGVGSGSADQLLTGRNHSTPVPTAASTPVVAAPVATAAQTSAEEFYRKVWQIAKDDFLWQDRLTDWDKWEHKYDGKLNTQADAEKAINEMLDSLKDGYTYFRNNGATQHKATQTAATNVVTYRMIGTVGYIKIATFGSENVASETEAALKALNKAGAKSYVVDLRDNGGGYVAQAFSITGMFLDQGEFATVKGNKDGKPYTWEMTVTATKLEEKENGTVTSNRSRVGNLTGKKPVFILVNGGSASASEMFAGSLQDNGRAKVVGMTTFGKGIAQLNIDLPYNTSMQVTFAKLYQPAGDCIHGVGMTPDYVVGVTPKVDAQLTRALELAQPKAKP